MAMASRPTGRTVPRGGPDQGATSLEWALLAAAIVLPAWFVIDAALDILVDHYRMMTTLNALPFP